MFVADKKQTLGGRRDRQIMIFGRRGKLAREKNKAEVPTFLSFARENGASMKEIDTVGNRDEIFLRVLVEKSERCDTLAERWGGSQDRSQSSLSQTNSNQRDTEHNSPSHHPRGASSESTLFAPSSRCSPPPCIFSPCFLPLLFAHARN